MKKYLLLLVLVCSGIIIATAQTQYQVTAKSSLNVRTQASKDGHLVGKLQHGERIEVYTITNGWAQIYYNGQSAYVNASYIKKCPVQSINQKNKNDFSLIDLDKYAIGNVSWMVYIILALSLILWFLRKFIRGEDNGINGVFLYHFNWIAFLLTCGIEIVYALLMGCDTTWFCFPNAVGWFWSIINFFIFGFLAYNQVMCFFDILLDINASSGGGYNIKVGYYSWIIFVIASVIMGIVSWDEYTIWIVIPFAICQLIQIILIFIGIVPSGGWLNAILCVAIYIMGSLSTMLVLLHFVVLLLIVIIAIGVLSAIGSSSSSSTDSEPDSEPEYETYTDLYIDDEISPRHIKHDNIGSGIDQYGDRWERNWDDTWSKKY